MRMRTGVLATCCVAACSPSFVEAMQTEERVDMHFAELATCHQRSLEARDVKDAGAAAARAVYVTCAREVNQRYGVTP